MTRFAVTDLPLAGLKRIERQRLGDARGFLARLFCAQELRADGWSKPIAQINHTYSARAGTLRGLHFQRPPSAEMKLVSCLRGAVFDVAVDLRARSSSLLAWHAETLSADNNAALLIPEGFAHGFQALTDDVELLYCHSMAYDPLAESGFHPLDPRLAIAWPLPVTLLSDRDRSLAQVEAGFAGLAGFEGALS